jgi:hypothetical protein
MFTFQWTPEADMQYRELKSRAEKSLQSRKNKEKQKGSKDSQADGLFKQVQKALKLLKENPKHPGLQTHEYHSLRHPFDKKQKVFEAYAQNKTPGAYRVFWCYGPGKQEITLIAITPHP